MVEPTGADITIETTMPKNEHSTEITAEHNTTPLKLLMILIAERAGNITRAEISSEPTRFIPNTIITAIITAIRRLNLSVFIPVAFAKFSSNVTANILL